MQKKWTSVFENGLIWFGAGVSLAEILTGTYFAPLGFGKGLLAILTGHVIGCLMLFFAGLIGGKTRKSAMETTKMSFGSRGGLLFSILNIVQLVGWTGIMIYDGALAANGVLGLGNWVWCVLIGALIIVWILVGIENLGKVNNPTNFYEVLDGTWWAMDRKLTLAGTRASADALYIDCRNIIAQAA